MVFVSCGALLLIYPLLSIVIVSPEFTFFMGILGFFLFLYAALLTVKYSFEVELHQQMKLLSSLKDNKEGLAWVWIVGFFLSLPMCGLVYWVLDYPFELIAEQMTGLYTLTGTMAYSWMAVHFTISYLLAFVLIFTILWVIINSKSPTGMYG